MIIFVLHQITEYVWHKIDKKLFEYAWALMDFFYCLILAFKVPLGWNEDTSVFIFASHQVTISTWFRFWIISISSMNDTLDWYLVFSFQVCKDEAKVCSYCMIWKTKVDFIRARRDAFSFPLYPVVTISAVCESIPYLRHGETRYQGRSTSCQGWYLWESMWCD